MTFWSGDRVRSTLRRSTAIFGHPQAGMAFRRSDPKLSSSYAEPKLQALDGSMCLTPRSVGERHAVPACTRALVKRASLERENKIAFDEA
jgi:hypothetical protein